MKKPPAMPTSVAILGKAYSIETVDKPCADNGECMANECRIKIYSDQAPQQAKDTLLHEVMHGIDYEMDCSMREAQIRRMATGLLEVLRANPSFAAFLLS